MRIDTGSWLALPFIALILVGCPDEPKSVEVPEACVAAYKDALVEAADEDTVCDASFDAVGGEAEQFDALHAEVWTEPSEALLEACSDDVDVRVELLSDEQIFHVRCLLECDMSDPTGC